MALEYNLIVAAMDEEFNSLKNVIKDYKEIEIAGEKLLEFNIKDEKYLLGLGKIGKVHTGYYLGKLFSNVKIKRVFNIGTSGALDSSLNISDVIIATKVGYYDVDVTDFNYELGQICGCPRYFECDMDFVNSKKIDSKYNTVKGIILSGDTFTNKKNYKEGNLSKMKDKPVAVEMESGAVGQCCYLAHIPFIIIRSISDIVTKDDNYKTFDQNINSVTTNSALVLLELLK